MFYNIFEDVIKLKDEPLFQNDKLSVSWHADSSLEHFSSIAVYSFTTPINEHSKCLLDTKNDEEIQPTKKSKKNSTLKPIKDAPLNDNANNTTSLWKLALKVSPNSEGPNAQKLKLAPIISNHQEAPSNVTSKGIQ